MIILIVERGVQMKPVHKKYKELRCRDFGADCDFIAGAETEEEVMKHGHEHGCKVHGKCGVSPEGDKKMKSHIKDVWV